MAPRAAKEIEGVQQRTNRSSEDTASTSTSLPSPSPPTVWGTLLKLPPELRDIIYAFLFSAGDLSILRVCRGLNTEAQSILYRAGVFRQDVAYYLDYRFHDTLSEFLVQNFELRCNLSTRLQARSIFFGNARTSTVASASHYAHGNICRGQILLKLIFGASSSLSMVEDEITNFLAGPEDLIGFQHLVVHFSINKASDQGPGVWGTANKNRVTQLVKYILEPTLGPAHQHYDGNDCLCLGFRPWRFVKHRYQRLEPLWTPYDSLGRQMLYTRFHATNCSIDESEHQ